MFIVSGPRSVNVSGNENVSFECVASDSATIVWYLNNTYISDFQHRIIFNVIPDDAHYKSVLIIAITRETEKLLNNTVVSCTAVNNEDHANSMPATLHVLEEGIFLYMILHTYMLQWCKEPDWANLQNPNFVMFT